MITGVVHAGISVTDIDRSIAFYTEVLGLKAREKEEVRRSRGDKLGVPGAVIQTCVLELPDSDETIELIAYLEPRPLFNYGLPINNPGQIHLAFRVDDIEAEIKRLKEHNVAFFSDTYEYIQDGPIGGWKWIYFKDPDGTTLELIEETRPLKKIGQ